MPEIRLDPLSGERVIVAGERSERPNGAPTCQPPAPIDRGSDPFAEGHEDRTPPELYADRLAGSAPDTPGWRVRVVPNLYPALLPADTALLPADTALLPADAAPLGIAHEPRVDLTSPAADDGSRSSASAVSDIAAAQVSSRPGPPSSSELFASTPAIGAHEVIVNGPQSVLSLAQLEPEQVVAALATWRERMRWHSETSSYVQLIVNERREAGASLPHTHAQLYALRFVPANVARERERFNAHAARTMGQNLLGDLLQEEVRLKERIVAIDDEAVLLAPFASKLPYQLMLVPRRPTPRFQDDGPLGAKLLHHGLLKLSKLLGSSPPLNLWVRTAPAGAEHFCWRIDVMPRLTHLAGLELSTGLSLNIVAPERAAALLREA